jgi:UDP-N-acetylenolpyruvoylglucosamine reductase
LRQSHFPELAARLSPDTLWRRDEPLAKHTTWRVGGRADFYVEPESEEELAQILRFCAGRNWPFCILGRGSNVLIKDGGIRGVVVCLAHPNFCRIQAQGHGLWCGAGARLQAVVGEALHQGLTGLEFLEGIPGSVGGALRMNAGAMGSDMFAVVERVRFMDAQGQVDECLSARIPAEYRRWAWFKNHFALGALFRAEPASPEVIEEKLKAFNQRRRQTQPTASSAGCVFKNPAAMPAGRVIEELGLKGQRVGGAVVSAVHGNFIVNEGNATAQDILNLIELIKERVKARRGIELETEIEIIGES